MHYITLCLAFVCCLATPSFAQLSAGSDAPARDAETPVFFTAEWSNERELLVLFEQSQHRVVLADAIVANIVSDSNLNPLKRFDGLIVCAHVFYNESELDKAASTFVSASEVVGADPIRRIDAIRMLGQIYLATGDYAAALDRYSEAYTFHLDLHQQGIAENQAAYFVQFVVHAAIANDQASLAIDFIDEALEEFSDNDIVVQSLLFDGANVLFNAGEPTAATAYLESLLDNYPLFGLDDPVGCPRLEAELLQVKLEVADLESSCHQAAIVRCLALVNDSRFRLCPGRFALANMIASCLDRNGDSEYSNKLRYRMLSAVELALQEVSLTPESLTRDRHVSELKRLQVLLLWNTAVVLETVRNDEAAAIALLEKICNDLPEAFPDISDLARSALDRLTAP